jgi:hypothetical protein
MFGIDPGERFGYVRLDSSKVNIAALIALQLGKLAAGPGG